MKKINFLFIILLTFLSCNEDESLDPRPDLVRGQFVELTVTSPSLDFNDLSNSSFSGILRNPSQNVSKYELFVRRRNANGVNTSDFILLKTVTSFPHELNISAQDIATALNVPITDLQDGDIYRLIAYSYDQNGVKAGYLNLSRVVQTNKGYKQGYRFSTNLSSTNDPDNPFNNYAPFGL